MGYWQPYLEDFILHSRVYKQSLSDRWLHAVFKTPFKKLSRCSPEYRNVICDRYSVVFRPLRIHHVVICEWRIVIADRIHHAFSPLDVLYMESALFREEWQLH